jgi:NAD(P)-dependent dehydrogenase (short-subunit alcohol dehydrogenase family)
MKMDFNGKRVLVTGGTRGIGRSIVEGFLGAGARVALHGSSPDSVNKAAAEIQGSAPAVKVASSLATVEGCRLAVEAAVSGLGGLDVLVNNAGRWNLAAVDTAEEATWDEIIDVNLKGAFFVTKFALPALRASNGNIVNIASISGISAESGTSIYCLSKAGLIHMTRCHAWEFAPSCEGQRRLSGAHRHRDAKWGRAWVLPHRRRGLPSLRERLCPKADRARWRNRQPGALSRLRFGKLCDGIGPGR